MANKVTTCILMPQSQLDAVKAYATSRGLSMSALLRVLMTRELENPTL